MTQHRRVSYFGRVFQGDMQIEFIFINYCLLWQFVDSSNFYDNYFVGKKKQ